MSEASHLPPGAALDVGCGQGDDAIWLAGRGWRVTGVDVSTNVLARAAGRADAAGVSAAITWEHHDLASSFPAGTFDLVTSCYLHSPVELPREAILRKAAAAVAPGGTLLVVGHAGSPSWAGHQPDLYFPTPRDVLDGLALPVGEWVVERAEDVERAATDPDGNPGTRPDNVVRARRRA